MEKRVIIAAGHGGGDSGAVAQGTTEATETIDITNRVVSILRADKQLTVEQVPNEYGLVDSINWVNARWKNINNGLAIEIHKNSGGGTGIEVWYPSGGDDTSKNQARAILDKLVASTGLKSRGIKDASTNRFGKLGWTDDTNTYAVLIEAGFIDVDAVGADANAKYADGIAKGLLAVWGLSLTPVTPPTPVPQPVTWLYKVSSTADGKQLGVYNQKAGAWTKYQSVGGAAKITDTAGNDLTPAFVLEFTPPAPTPPTTETDPVVQDLKDRVNAIEVFIAKAKQFFESINWKFWEK